MKDRKEMDKEALEMRVAELLREIEKMGDADKRRFIVEFISCEIEKDNTPIYLDKFDLTNIKSDASSNWNDSPHGKSMGGSPISSEHIRTIMWVKGVISCLRRCNILHRIVDIKYDD